jgi:hypothetical protein
MAILLAIEHISPTRDHKDKYVSRYFSLQAFAMKK